MKHLPRCLLFLLSVAIAGCESARQSFGDSMSTLQQGARDLRKSSAERLADDLALALADRRGATLAARVLDLETGQVLFQENPDEAVIPASNGKLAVSAAGLDLFGPYHSFKTYLISDGDDLWIVGSGDPGTGDPRIADKFGRSVTSIFDDWASALRRRGINRVRGNLYYFDGVFDDQLTHPNWRKSFLVDWYAAPVSGLNFNDNCIDVTAHPSEQGQPARIEVVPPNTIARITNHTVTGVGGKPEITRAPAAPEFTLTGGIGEKHKFESKPITDPGAFFADAFRTHVRAAGIVIEGETIRATAIPFPATGPSIDRIIAVHETAMPDVLWRINKNSQNMFAEALSKAMGREFALRRDGVSVPGSWALGEAATKDFLERHGINAGQFVAADGSGLARENRVTARLITDLLAVMWRHPHGKVWRESLAVGGVDGTIRNRQKDFPGRIFAKTGFIGGVRSLSGYAKASDGKWLAFCFIFNNIEGDVKPYERLQDDAAWRLIHYPRRAPARARPDEPTTRPATQPATQPSTQPAPESEDPSTTQPAPEAEVLPAGQPAPDPDPAAQPSS